MLLLSLARCVRRAAKVLASSYSILATSLACDPTCDLIGNTLIGPREDFELYQTELCMHSRDEGDQLEGTELGKG